MIIYKMKNFFVLTRNAEFEWKYHDSECDLMRENNPGVFILRVEFKEHL